MTLLLSVQGITKRFGPRPLFSDLSLELRAGERLGLIGPNGSGKSTLLKLLAGAKEVEPDAGTRSLRRGSRVGYVAQDDLFPAGQTVREVLLTALAEEPIEEYEREPLAAITLTQVGFVDFEQRADQLSGGWRKRLSLARELVRKPDLLLLDEPTNHLDLPGIAWLERLLRASAFGYLVATHDRTFLRAVADEVIEVSRVYPRGSFRAPGSYDDFAEKREAFLEAQARQQESVANQVRRENEWLGRKAAARTRKAGSRIDAAAERRTELQELQYRNAAAGAAGIDFVATGRQTRKLLSVTGIAKTVGSRQQAQAADSRQQAVDSRQPTADSEESSGCLLPAAGRLLLTAGSRRQAAGSDETSGCLLPAAGRLLFEGIDLLLTPGTKLGLLGPNGSGKSTLLRVLAGAIPPDAGTVVRADGLRSVMFEQGRAMLDPSATLRKALCPNGDTVMFGDRPTHVAAWAKKFLFQPEHLDTLVGQLSGGEQARVRIAQLMLQPADLLLLDEPTNDLDIPALEVLEDNLAEFAGALVIVSHDRTLMDRLCTEVVGLDGRGGAALYASVDQWLTAYERSEADIKQPAAGKEAAPKKAAAVKPVKLSYREQQEWEQMEAAILNAEQALAECEAAVESAASAGHIVLTDACRALEEAQHTVEQLYARWGELEAKRARAGS